uniref:Uncharacterized protein n=1 Tax=Micrurus carvalhoi TaxID=3147026 RepID=A0A2H6N8Q7_9SAUR
MDCTTIADLRLFPFNKKPTQVTMILWNNVNLFLHSVSVLYMKGFLFCDYHFCKESIQLVLLPLFCLKWYSPDTNFFLLEEARPELVWLFRVAFKLFALGSSL